MATEAFIYDAIRTPRGKGKSSGSLHSVKPIDLSVGLLNELADRTSEAIKTETDDIVLGCVSPVADQGADIAKTAALAAGWDATVAGMQLNRFCASGLEAVNIGAMKVRSDFEDLVVVGGVESMSRVPMGSDGGPWAMDPATAMGASFVPQGIGADLIATINGFSREDVDNYAATSHHRAHKAQTEGYFDNSVIPVRDVNGSIVLKKDETIRPESSVESLSGLNPSFAAIAEMGGFGAVALQNYHWVEAINHVHTAANSSGIVDGAAAMLIGNEAKGTELGLTPRARIVGTALSGDDHVIMLTGPMPATRKVLDKAGLTIDEIDLFEVNEAFAAVPMAFMKEMGVDHEKVNVNGGAIAMGHPLGATGCMIVGTLLDELERRDLKRGLATLCVGGGMGIATIIERV